MSGVQSFTECFARVVFASSPRARSSWMNSLASTWPRTRPGDDFRVRGEKILPNHQDRDGFRDRP